MKKRKITILILIIMLMFTVSIQSVFGAASTTVVNRPARVNNTYDWGAGIYGMNADKKQYVSVNGVKNTSVDYDEISYSNQEIEPSVGYAYYVARTAGLDDKDMQSVIYMSDRWGNTSNVKNKGSKQEIQGKGVIYQRASQYGSVYYGILQDAIKNNKKVLKIKDEENVKKNIKVLADQDSGTYTVGPYKLELNVASNKYTKEGAEILLKELSKNGNSGYAEGNAFAKYNGITGINGKEAIFVDANGKQIAFPDFVPGSEKDFYIRFKPNNDGAISSTGNPIVNVSYLTKFVAANLIKGVPRAIKFGDASSSSTNVANNSLEVTDVKSLTKRNYAALQTIRLGETSSSIMAKLGASLGISELAIETAAMRVLGVGISTPTSEVLSEETTNNGNLAVAAAVGAQQNESEAIFRTLGASNEKPAEYTEIDKAILEGGKGAGDKISLLDSNSYSGTKVYTITQDDVENARKKQEAWDEYNAQQKNNNNAGTQNTNNNSSSQNKAVSEPAPLSQLEKDIIAGNKKEGQWVLLEFFRGETQYAVITEEDVKRAQEKQKAWDEYNAQQKNNSNAGTQNTIDNSAKNGGTQNTTTNTPTNSSGGVPQENRPVELTNTDKTILENDLQPGETFDYTDSKGNVASHTVTEKEYKDAHRKQEALAEWNKNQSTTNNSTTSSSSGVPQENRPVELTEIEKTIIEKNLEVGDTFQYRDSNGYVTTYKVSQKDYDEAHRKQEALDAWEKNAKQTNNSQQIVHKPDGKNNAEYKYGDKTFIIHETIAKDKETIEKISAALNRNPLSKEEALKQGLVEVSLEDVLQHGLDEDNFFMVDWAGQSTSTEKTLLNDPIAAATITEDPPTQYKVYDDKGYEKENEYEEYLEGITVKTTATYLVTSTINVTVPESNVSFQISEDFIVNVKVEKHIDLEKRTYKPGDGKKALEAHKSEITDELDKLKTAQDFAGSDNCELQGFSKEKGWQQAITAADLAKYFPEGIIGDGSPDEDEDEGPGKDTPGGQSSPGSSSSSGGSGGPGGSGGSGGSGSSSSGSPPSSSEPVKPDKPNGPYVSNDTVKKIEPYIEVGGNDVHTDWSDETNNGDGSVGPNGEITSDGKNNGDSNKPDGNGNGPSGGNNGGNNGGENGDTSLDPGVYEYGDGSEDKIGNANTLKGIGPIGLIGAPINMQIGGTVWKESKNVDGKNDSEEGFAGIQVELYESDGKLSATTTTDKDGKYRFYGRNKKGITTINGLKKYYVQFTYNGQVYQATYFKNDLTGKLSNARDINREQYNIVFKEIESNTENYKTGDNWNKSYARNQKIENDSEDFVDAAQGNAVTYEDVYNEFLSQATLGDVGDPNGTDHRRIWNGSKTYASVVNGSLKNWLEAKGVTKEYEPLKKFMNDTFMQAKTNGAGEGQTLYPVYNKFVIKTIENNSDVYKHEKTDSVKLEDTYTYLYSINSDQSRNAGFGVYTRVINDVALQKDVYKATVLVNGKKEEYIYNKKSIDKVNDKDVWDVGTRNQEGLYHGDRNGDAYYREVRRSDYLYNSGNAYGQDGEDNLDKKNLQVFVTYRISVKNQGSVNVKINEIADYYDADMFEFDGVLNGDDYANNVYNYNKTEPHKAGQESNYKNSYVGSDENGTFKKDLTVRAKGRYDRAGKELSGANYNYKTVFLSGIDDLVEPNGQAHVYVTFKVKVDENTDKVKLDQDLSSGGVFLGKKNIAEINAYGTYYPNGTAIPNSLNDKNELVNTTAEGNETPAGIIDVDSTPGDLKQKDLNDNGDVITDPDIKAVDRQQDDTDKAPNLRLIINKEAEEAENGTIRTFRGYAFEDDRTETVENAVVGDGQYGKDHEGNDENKINGVTVQLVELVQKVDEKGIATGEYIGEKVWGSYKYNGVDKENLNNPTPDYSRYYTGRNDGVVVLSGSDDSILSIRKDTKLSDGEYVFKSVPAGDFYIRFTYGDTAQTTLSNDSKNEVTALLSGNGVDGKEGLNAKSYNGQDYKSTSYQKIQDNDKDKEKVEQNTEYNGIKGYINYEEQNAYKVDDLVIDSTNDVVYKEPSVNKSALYYYDIAESEKISEISDAKDVYDYRAIANEYGKGFEGTLKNNRAEILASFEKLGTYKPEDANGVVDFMAQIENQQEMLKELMANTKVASQTGIINSQIEKNRDYITDGDDRKYVLDNINLGLVERPEAELKLTKEVTNFRLSNGTEVVFDKGQSTKNLSFSKHNEHIVNRMDKLKGRIESIVLGHNRTDSRVTELVQGYVDNETIKGGKAEIQYRVKVENVGEVDYLSKQFYYTGIPTNEGGKLTDTVSKTNVKKVVDYVSNKNKYGSDAQKSGATWITASMNQVMNSAKENGTKEFVLSKENDVINRDLINRQYADEVNSYEQILITEMLEGDLTPEISNKDASMKETSLVLSAQTMSSKDEDNLVYNNLSEIVEITNDQGRRTRESIMGNEEMADQKLGADADKDAVTSADRIYVKEIDADSSQKVLIMPPTGRNENYTLPVMIAVSTIGLVMAILMTIKKKTNKVTSKKTSKKTSSK